jgi:hypothetical protein
LLVAGAITLAGASAASAQPWWNSEQYGPPEVEDGRPVPSIASSLPHKGDPGGYR